MGGRDATFALLDALRRRARPPGCIATKEAGSRLRRVPAFLLVSPWTPVARARGLIICEHERS